MVTYRVHRPQVLFFVAVYVACWETAENWHWISWIYSIQFNAIEFDSMLKWNTIEIIAEFQLLFLISDLFIAGGETTITTLRWVYLAILSVKLRATIWWCFDVVAVDICLSAGHLVSGDIHRIAGQDQRGNYQQHRLWRNPFVSRPWLSLRSCLASPNVTMKGTHVSSRYAQRSLLPYFEAFLHELLRFAGVVPGMWRNTSEDCSVGVSGGADWFPPTFTVKIS